MKSVKLCGHGVAAIAEVPEPTPQPHEVVIQTAISALCGSELHGYRNAGSAKGNSGHEAAGVVLRVGTAVTTLQPGQRVGVSAIAGCGVCGYCARGQSTWCTKRRFYGSMHAEQFVVAATACHVLPDDVDWKIGVLISGDGLGVPFHTSTKIIRPDTTTIAVFGAGPVGLGNVLLQAFLGKKVIAVDVSAPRLELAARLGAAATFNPNDTDVIAAIRDYTGGVGADLCIEAAGRPETALNCFAAVKTGGQVIFNGEQGAVNLSISEQFIRRDITATGSWFYHYAEFHDMLRLFRSGLPLASLITDVYPLDDVNTAFADFAAGKTGKAVISYGC